MRHTLDTNVLVYSIEQTDRRQDAALAIIAASAERDCVLTLQALGEFFVASQRRKLCTRAEAAAQIGRWLTVFGEALPYDDAAVRTALAESVAGRFGYWDALLLASAMAGGCEAAISEDMGHGATVGTIRVVRAFEGNDVSADARAVLA